MFSGCDWHLGCCEITLILLLWHTLLMLIMPYNDMMLNTDVYCMFSLLMARLWWPCYDALVYDLTLSNGDIIDRHYRWWSFYALHTGGMSENVEACNAISVVDARCSIFVFKFVYVCGSRHTPFCIFYLRCVVYKLYGFKE